MRKLEKSQQLCQSLFQGDFLNAIGDQNTRKVQFLRQKSAFFIRQFPKEGVINVNGLFVITITPLYNGHIF